MFAKQVLKCFSKSNFAATTNNNVNLTLSSLINKNFISTECDDIHVLFNPTEEHLQLRQSVKSFSASKINEQAAKHDLSGNFNMSLFKEVGEMGFLGVTIPEEHGGVGMDSTAAVIIHHEMSKYDPGFTLAYLAHSMLFVNNFYYCSNEAQKKKWLPGVLSGEILAGMGMTEPGAGTDVLGMKTKAVKKGNQYILNGSKTYITNGFDGQIFLVYAKVDGKITSFVVEKGTPGFSTAKEHTDKCGMRGSTMCELYFEDCAIPEENLLGSEGQGVTHMMRNLEIERLVLAAMSVGIADRCVDLMLEHANNRKTFGAKLTEYGQIQRYIAESYAVTEAAKCLTYNVAKTLTPDTKNRIGSDAAKLFATPVGKQVADNALQVFGGAGYCKEYPVERLWRDAKLLEIGGGTLEAHHKNLTKDLSKLL